MRKSEITPELIKLSKKAKDLGFPQDVERGDWVCDVTDDELYLIETLKEEGDVLILSFSRCEAFFGKDVSKLHEDSARKVTEKLQK